MLRRNVIYCTPIQGRAKAPSGRSGGHCPWSMAPARGSLQPLLQLLNVTTSMDYDDHNNNYNSPILR